MGFILFLFKTEGVKTRTISSMQPNNRTRSLVLKNRYGTVMSSLVFESNTTLSYFWNIVISYCPKISQGNDLFSLKMENLWRSKWELGHIAVISGSLSVLFYMSHKVCPKSNISIFLTIHF